MTTNTYTETALYRQNSPPHGANRLSLTAAYTTLEFDRFRVLLRQRKLVADGVPIELGSRALDLLLVLLEAHGSLVTKDELLRRVWPGIVVAEDNLKMQICGYARLLAKAATLFAPSSAAATGSLPQFTRPSPGVLRRGGGTGQIKGCFPDGFLGDRGTVGVSRDLAGRRFDPAHGACER
jgi:hypothetical protein